MNSLFPVHPIRPLIDWPDDEQPIPLITAEELLAAARQIKNKTAPGLDEVTNEALKIIADARPEILL